MSKAKSNRPALAVGDRVRLLVDKEPYYSGYAGNPKIVITAGTIGTVGAVDVPPVTVRKWSKRQEEDFTCVDFNLPGVYQGDERHNNTVWRAAVYRDEMEKVS